MYIQVMTTKIQNDLISHSIWCNRNCSKVYMMRNIILFFVNCSQNGLQLKRAVIHFTLRRNAPYQ
jgi:hypothetical protein